MIKQSIVTIFGAGILNKLDLNYDEENGAIKGKIGLKVAEREVVTLEVFEPEMYGEKENFKFKAFQTVIEEYKDVTMVEKPEDATKVFIGVNKKAPHFPKATISINTYVDGNGSVINRPKNKLTLLNRVKDESKFNPSLQFKIENFVIEEIRQETDYKTSQLTDRGIFNGYVIDYKGIAKPIELILTKEGFEYARKTWKKYDVVDISGLVINKAIPSVPKTTQGFGTMPGSNSFDYIREYLVNAGSEPKYDSFTKQDIENALKGYEELVVTLTTTAETTTEEENMNW